MSFGENLRQIRKEQGLTQEDLAELMDVSRQAVSKWEQGEGYPETQKLLLLASKLNISLDSLLSSEITSQAAGKPVLGTITIFSPTENVIVSCYKVQSSQKMRGGKRAPQYALFGISPGGCSFWGEPTTFLGWYASHNAISMEVLEIQHAIKVGLSNYELKYASKVKRNWLNLPITEE